MGVVTVTFRTLSCALFFLLFAKPAAAQFTCFAYDKTTGAILTASLAETASANATSYTSSTDIGLVWMRGGIPADLDDDQSQRRYRFNGTDLVRLGAGADRGRKRRAIEARIDELHVRLDALEKWQTLYSATTRSRQTELDAVQARITALLAEWAGQ